MKKKFILSLLLLFTGSSYAQLSNIVSIAESSYNGSDGATFLNNGDFIVYGIKTASESYIYRMTPAGDTVFSKLHIKDGSESSIYANDNSIVETSDGGSILEVLSHLFLF